jgi:hypothetical protein
VRNQREAAQVEGGNDGGESARGPFEPDVTRGHTGTLSGSGRIEADTPEVFAQTKDQVTPHKRPEAGVYKEQRRPLANVRNRDPRAIDVYAKALEWPHALQ